MHPALVLLLLLVVEPPRSLSPEAGEHNTRAMQHYDAGRFGPAVDEFYAAYQAMPDARRDREGRELLLGSMRATLLDLHVQTGEPAPLCRLQNILREHIDALGAAYPDDPEMLETRSARARHEEVTRQLADISPTACEPVPPPAPASVVTAAPATPAPATSSPPPSPSKSPSPLGPDIIPPRHLKIAGGVTLGLGAALLGVMVYGIVAEADQRTRIADIRDRCPECPFTAAEYDGLQDLRATARTSRGIAIGTGITAGVAIALGGALLGMAHRSPAKKRWSAEPWWSPTSTGLTVRVQLGRTRG